MAWDILACRANGLGTFEIDKGHCCEAVAINTARAVFDSDHSLTMVWVMDRAAHVAVEVFTRDPPGMG